MLNVIAKAEQTVAAGQNIVFTNTRVNPVVVDAPADG